jgi:hypothetical protein
MLLHICLHGKFIILLYLKSIQINNPFQWNFDYCSHISSLRVRWAMRRGSAPLIGLFRNCLSILLSGILSPWLQIYIIALHSQNDSDLSIRNRENEKAHRGFSFVLRLSSVEYAPLPFLKIYLNVSQGELLFFYYPEHIPDMPYTHRFWHFLMHILPPGAVGSLRFFPTPLVKLKIT